MIRSCLLVYISLSLLLGQASLPMFTHVCHGMGKTWTALGKPPKSCCGKRKKDLRAHHAALQKPKSFTSFDKSRCCDDHVKYASLSIQLISQVVKFLSQENACHHATHSLEGIFFNVNLHAYDGVVHVHGPPGKLSGRDLLIAHQHFLC